jgi:hypothetical protein
VLLVSGSEYFPLNSYVYLGQERGIVHGFAYVNRYPDSVVPMVRYTVHFGYGILEIDHDSFIRMGGSSTPTLE